MTSRIYIVGWPRSAAIALTLSVVLCFASAAHADQTVTSAGPLTQIGLGSDLHCSANYTGDDFGEFYGNTACGTFLDVGGPVGSGGTVYGTPNLPAAEVASTPYTEDAQTPISGDGSAGNPYKVSTQVNAGTTGLSISQTDTYVTGAEAYQSTALITNSASTAQTAVLYHGADCFLGNADFGDGFQDNASGGIFCSKNANNSPAGRIEGFVPVEGGSNYVETNFSAMWTDIGSGQPLPNTCDCSVYQDNGMAISWTVTVPAGGSITRSWATDFSPVGTIRASSYVALGDSVAAGEGIADDWHWNGSMWYQGTPFSWDTTSGQSNSECHQTLQGYPHVLSGLLSASLLDLGCTSASTNGGILGPESGKSGPQLGGLDSPPNTSYDNAHPDVVSLTVGADDVDFTDKVIACYTPLRSACGSAGDESTFLGQLADFKVGLNQVLNEIKDRGVADGQIPVVAITEYYSPFPNSYPTHSSCIDISPIRRAGITLTNAEMQYLERSLTDLNGTIDDVAATFPNVVIVPAPLSFAQHRWCSSDPWVYGPSVKFQAPTSHSPFHPTPDGQTAIAQNIANFISDERHVDVGTSVPLSFGAISLVLNSVQAAGTAYFNPLGTSTVNPQAQTAREGTRRLLTRRAVRAALATSADSSFGTAAIPPTSTFSPVQSYSTGTSAQYTNGLTITLPSLGAADLYEVTNGAWQLIPTTTDGTHLTATLTTLGTLALGNPAPQVTAAFTDSGDNGQAPATVTFDASSSTVGSGSITGYEWDFGDGNTGTGVDTSHAYDASGTYTVTLTTTSNAGASDITTRTVTVTDAPPVAVVTYPTSATAGSPTRGFDASASHAASGPISDTYWDFGDSSAVVDSVTTTHTFATSGAYTVNTTVFDDEGSSASATKVLSVAPAPGTKTPTVIMPTPKRTTKKRARLSFGKHIAVSKDRLALTLSCAKTGASCVGKLKLVVKVGRRAVTVAAGSFHLKAGKHKTVFLRIRARKTELKKASSITVASAKTRSGTVTLTLALHHKRRH